MVEFTAHRGESRDAPENTMAAFRLAWERGIRSVELDVHLSRDGVLVVHHDGDTGRMTGQNWTLRSTDYADLATLDTGSKFGPAFVGERIPRIEEVLRATPADGRLLVELKTGPEAVAVLERAMSETGAAAAQVEVICFEAEVLAEVRRRLPELRVQFLAEYTPEVSGRWREALGDWIGLAARSGFHGLGLDRRIPLDREAVQAVSSEGLGLHVWTVDDLDRAKELIEVGVRWITSNRAAWMRDQLRS